MSGNVNSRKLIYINFSGGNFQLKRVESGNASHEGKIDVVLAVGVLGGAGFRETEGGGELSFEVYRTDGAPEVPWAALYKSKEYFSMTLQDPGGMREQFRSCRVAQIPDQKFGTDGNIMDSVKVKFLQYSVIAVPAVG